MKKIEAIIRPEKFQHVKQALEYVGCSGMMITEIEGHGKQKGTKLLWRGETYGIELLPKIKLEVVVRDEDVEAIVNAILENARTGEAGDGKIFIYNVEEAIRIRTGERGESVL